MAQLSCLPVVICQHLIGVSYKYQDIIALNDLDLALNDLDLALNDLDLALNDLDPPMTLVNQMFNHLLNHMPTNHSSSY